MKNTNENEQSRLAPVSGSALKDLVIKQAFGENWSNLNSSAQQCALKNNGWVASILDHASPDCDFDFETNAWRPKSLKDVECKNLWVQIFSKEDLPRFQIPCWIRTKDDEQLAYYVPHKMAFGGVDNDYYYTEVKAYCLIDAP